MYIDSYRVCLSLLYNIESFLYYQSPIIIIPFPKPLGLTQFTIILWILNYFNSLRRIRAPGFFPLDWGSLTHFVCRDKQLIFIPWIKVLLMSNPSFKYNFTDSYISVRVKFITLHDYLDFYEPAHNLLWWKSVFEITINRRDNKSRFSRMRLYKSYNNNRRNVIQKIFQNLSLIFRFKLLLLISRASKSQYVIYTDVSHLNISREYCIISILICLYKKIYVKL